MTAITLLISVGGATGPIVYSIRENRPEKVIFFVSSGSRVLVSEKILPELMRDPGKIPDHEFVVTADEQDLGASTFVLMREVPGALARLNVSDLDWPQLVDYTGGTKTMSSALVWASSRYPCKISYIGTAAPEGRTREGLGTVIDGREARLLRENPWDRVAWLEARSAIELFNRGQYGNAADILRLIQKKVSEELPLRLFCVLGNIFDGFRCWDMFDHRNALRLLSQNVGPLRDLAQVPQVLIPGLEEFTKSVEQLLEALKGIKPGEKSWALIHDLLANAHRRAELEQKYEDATARCYAAIEKIAQHELLLKFGIDASNALPAQLSDGLRQEYISKYGSVRIAKDGAQTHRLQFGLVPAMELLLALGDPIGLRFSECRELLRSHLAERNHSILAHGIRPMDRQKFRDLFGDALFLLNIHESELTCFPKL